MANAWDPHLPAGLGAAHASMDAACIFGVDGALWTSPNAHSDGAAVIAKSINNVAALQASGPTVNGVKYFITTAENGALVNGKKGEHGFSAHSSGKSVTIVFFSANSDPNSANVAAANAAAYMKGIGF